MPTLTYLGHSAFTIDGSGGRVVIDPFLSGNPLATAKPEEIAVDHVLLTHGHGDHIGDGLEIAAANNATIVAPFELANYCAAQGATVHPMHIGGAHDFPFGRVKLTIAHHGSCAPDGTYTGNPCGFLVTMDGTTFYHPGDTGLFLDMQLIGEMQPDRRRCPADRRQLHHGHPRCGQGHRATATEAGAPDALQDVSRSSTSIRTSSWPRSTRPGSKGGYYQSEGAWSTSAHPAASLKQRSRAPEASSECRPPPEPSPKTSRCSRGVPAACAQAEGRAGRDGPVSEAPHIEQIGDGPINLRVCTHPRNADLWSASGLAASPTLRTGRAPLVEREVVCARGLCAGVTVVRASLPALPFQTRRYRQTGASRQAGSSSLATAAMEARSR